MYLDDVIVYAKDLKDHQRKIDLLFERLENANLKLEPDKVQFLRKEVAFLGHVITEDGVKPDPDKIKAVKDFPTPQNVKNIRQALGLFGYYRLFLPDYAVKAKPLTELLKKDQPFTWGPEQQESFDKLRNCLIRHPILIYPDFSKTFTLTTDASDIAIGAVLSQEKNGFDHPIAYYSRALRSEEQRYSTTEKECLAALSAMRHFRPYLISKKFVLQADHEPLNYMHNRTDPGQRLMRWMFKFTDYIYDFKYKAGKLNTNADALSRNPTEQDINENLPNLRVMMIQRGKPRAPAPQAKDLGEEPPKRRPGRPKKAQTQMQGTEVRPTPATINTGQGVYAGTRSKTAQPQIEGKEQRDEPSPRLQRRAARMQAQGPPQSSSDSTGDEIYGTDRRKKLTRKMPKTSTPRDQVMVPETTESSEEIEELSSDDDEDEFESAKSAPPMPDEKTSALRIENEEDTDAAGNNSEVEGDRSGGRGKAPTNAAAVVTLTSANNESDTESSSDPSEDKTEIVSPLSKTMLTEDEIKKSANKFRQSLSQRQSYYNYSDSGEEETILQAEASRERSPKSLDSRTTESSEEESSLSDRIRDTLKSLASETERVVKEKPNRVGNNIESKESCTGNPRNDAEKTSCSAEDLSPLQQRERNMKQVLEESLTEGRKRRKSGSCEVRQGGGQTTSWIPALLELPSFASADSQAASEGVSEVLSDAIVTQPMTTENMVSSRQCLTYKSDNWVHFISTEVQRTDAISRLLCDVEAINLYSLKKQKPVVGQIFKTPCKQHFVYSIVVKERESDPINRSVLRNALRALKATLQADHKTSFRVSRQGDITAALQPGELSEALIKIFVNSKINVTLCYGKTVMPALQDRAGIIKTLHDSCIGGHKGFHQTYNKIRERYFWAGMRNQIQDYIRTCAVCQEKKIHRTIKRTPMLVTDTPLQPFDKVSMDTCGPLRTTPWGNRQMLTMQCHLTKYVIAVPLRDIKATTIADALAKHLICQFGAPRAILSDNGRSFVADIVRELLHILRIKQQFASTYRPQTDGALERSHAPLKDYIRCYSEKFSDWDQLVPFAVFAMNTAVHSSTNFTPFELVYGHVARFPLRVPTHEKLQTYNIYLQDLIRRLNEMQVIAGKNLIAAKHRSKGYYDRKSRNFEPRVGNYVRVLLEPRTNNTQEYYREPCKIVEVLSKKNVVIELPDGRHERKHVDELEPAHLRIEVKSD